MKPMLASPAGPVIPFPMLLSPKLDGIAKAVYRGSKGESKMKNTGKECAMLYREFCEWCDTVPYLELDPRLNTHSGRIEDGGYISNGVTAKAFAAWKAARCAPAAPQQQADALDAERWRFIKRKLCLSGNGDGTCAMQALNLPARILGWPDVGELAIAQFLDAAIDAAIAAAEENK